MNLELEIQFQSLNIRQHSNGKINDRLQENKNKTIIDKTNKNEQNSFCQMKVN